MASSLLYREVVLPKPTPEPSAGAISGIILSIISISVLSSFLTQRTLAVSSWRRLPFIVWVVYAIFVDSWLFVLVTAILHYGLGFNSHPNVCSAAIFLCLVCYVTTKILIYLFLVEKAFIIRGGTKERLKSKLYIFNSFGMLTVYLAVSILNFVYRIARMDAGECVIGMEKFTMIPLISFDLLVNVYLTLLFLVPLSFLYSSKNHPRTDANIKLRTVAMRTFVGALCTTTSSVVNLTVLMALDGEPGWVCLMCCNSDILFSAIVIQWVTSQDNTGAKDNHNKNNPCYCPRPFFSQNIGPSINSNNNHHYISDRPCGSSNSHSNTVTSTSIPGYACSHHPVAVVSALDVASPRGVDEEFRGCANATHGLVPDTTILPLCNVASEAALLSPTPPEPALSRSSSVRRSGVSGGDVDVPYMLREHIDIESGGGSRNPGLGAGEIDTDRSVAHTWRPTGRVRCEEGKGCYELG
ncbi:hypothetical protein F4775DRAFT_356628 [Biscogniauxia sp. FL1348]|nr:hypothetical protein F4775DRAFT_356628 [Biscogniauxia sp. FL1348]